LHHNFFIAAPKYNFGRFAFLAQRHHNNFSSSVPRSFNDEVAEGKVERRGFKSSLLTTARGFGKRSSPTRIADERFDVQILPPGVDVMIAIFCDFRQFSAKKVAFFL
jgi:hypothetical protein